MSSANEAFFREIVPTLSHFIGQYNLGDGEENFRGSTLYDVYPQGSSFRVCTHGSGADCGNFTMDDLVFWAFRSHWKLDGLFVEEWLEQFRAPDVALSDVEELL